MITNRGICHSALDLIKLNPSRIELEFMAAGLEEEIAGLQLQLEWIEDALAQLDDEP